MDSSTKLEQETPAAKVTNSLRDAYVETKKKLKDGQGVCGYMSGPSGQIYLVHSVGYRPPEILVFWCEKDALPARIVQHYSYCNVVFDIIELDNQKPPRPIGFGLDPKVES